MMINPHKLVAKVKRWNSPEFAGGKVYLPILSGNGYAKASRKIFKRASEAQEHANKLLERWMRLYDAAVIATSQP